jgi:hypothetical protein
MAMLNAVTVKKSTVLDASIRSKKRLMLFAVMKMPSPHPNL